jgi:hypothetical protein
MIVLLGSLALIRGGVGFDEPPVPTYYLLDSDGNFILDSDGNKIVVDNP